MAWLPVQQSLPTHRKTLQMAELLDCDPDLVAGKLVRFWLWAIDNAPDGRLAGIGQRTLALAAAWRGEPAAWLEAMESSGYLDRTDTGLEIHDWHKHAGKLIATRDAERERSARRRSDPESPIEADRSPEDQPPTAGQPPVNRRSTAGRVEKTTQDKTTAEQSTSPEESEEVSKPSAPGGAGKPSTPLALALVVPQGREYPDAFERFWTPYPRKIEKRAAFLEWRKRVKGGTPGDDLIAAARHYAAYCDELGTADEYTAHASTFLGPQRKFEDFVAGVPEVGAKRRAGGSNGRPTFREQAAAIDVAAARLKRRVGETP